ncbi:hypothetical protein GCM10010988_21630 [Cnuibacter physcomitrellae]|uniref:Uncharacterized protein n=1 Tax=Cnuibacter physcomitrellae TaxID=1619308 RepID=A0A1X9LNZ4_9MICO|nr:hypothetical protein [Cnuibacter physcomitrellae]ARJ06837.1 hypothetical protein B5808_17620 [Cnuibacter physcomitrellae]GGI38950.1 hypothetical protein GCM10010988_21630 [Cnuibacter physcomitrellae]
MSTPLLPPVPSTKARRPRRAHPVIIVSAWVTPVLLLGQFALLAAVPVALAVIFTLRDARSRALRWWVGALAVAYAAPLAIWAFRPDRAESLSKDISPILLGLVVALSAALLVKIYTRRKR